MHARTTDLASYIYSEPRAGLPEQLAKIAVTAADPPVEVIYIQPKKPAKLKTEGERCIDFETFAKHVDKFDDPLSRKFAEHLRLWKAVAGSRVPKT